MTFKKGDLIAGTDIESDCIGIIVAVDDEVDRVMLSWLHHWDSEMLERTWFYDSEEIKPFEGDNV